MEDQNIEGKDRETSALSKKSLRQHIRQRKARHSDEELVALSQPIVEAVPCEATDVAMDRVECGPVQS